SIWIAPRTKNTRSKRCSTRFGSTAPTVLRLKDYGMEWLEVLRIATSYCFQIPKAHFSTNRFPGNNQWCLRLVLYGPRCERSFLILSGKTSGGRRAAEGLRLSSSKFNHSAAGSAPQKLTKLNRASAMTVSR